jgi:hypothetical protein
MTLFRALALGTVVLLAALNAGAAVDTALVVPGG